MTYVASPFACVARRERGVTLVEVLVGALVGMLSVLLISQVLLTSEGQKRTTTGGSDAQVNGALGLYSIQRDLQTAGYGLTSSPDVIGCPISARYNGAIPAEFPGVLAPAVITREDQRPTGSVGDSIRMLSSSKGSFSVPTRIIPPGYAVGATEFPVRSALGFVQDDLALVASDGTQPCWVFQVTTTPLATDMRVLQRGHNATWNPSAGNAPDIPFADGSVLMNLGTLVDNRYEIRTNTNVLQVSTLSSANPAARVERDLQPDIVNLRAFYGRDTTVPPDGIIDTFDTATPTTNAGWRGVLAIRVILVARSSTWEKDIVTPSSPLAFVGVTPAVVPHDSDDLVDCHGVTDGCLRMGVGIVNETATVDEVAKHYRYKVFDAVIPLRNMLWSSQ